ncbi:hypothetical protein [Pantoea agglomerans]|uniref:hypothetical protein n=1 Tax=Enterobacter agglomerans TaxID=549 RepID=UPI001A9D0521|nr:hypothetical protein [Pantoea agglomerans]QTC49158.1 hypothetical protein H0Z11_12865 [Pantoea agglomerans]
MDTSLRITKYHNYDAEGNLVSARDEWTSYFDIGVKVSVDDYILVESEYVNFVLSLCDLLSVEKFTLSELEVFDDKGSVEYPEVVDITVLPLLVRDVLREKIWCKLVADEMEVHFGYDFYMYVICPLSLDFIKSKISTHLNVESFKSPYM